MGYTRVVIAKDFTESNEEIKKCFKAIKDCVSISSKPGLPGLSYKHFYNDYINSHNANIQTHKIDTTYILDEGEIIGVYFAIFYKVIMNNSIQYMARTIVGIHPAHKGSKKFNVKIVQGKYILFKALHPSKVLKAQITAVNPIIFSATVKHLKKYSPVPLQHEINLVKQWTPQQLDIESHNFLAEILNDPVKKPWWLIEVFDFPVNTTAANKNNYLKNPDPFKKWFIWKNNRYPEYGILTIFEVSLKNISTKLKGMLADKLKKKPK